MLNHAPVSVSIYSGINFPELLAQIGPITEEVRLINEVGVANPIINVIAYFYSTGLSNLFILV